MSLTGKQFDVFISYAHADSAPVADYLERELGRAGLATFKDTTDIMVGEAVLQRLSDAIAKSSYFIMLMSPGYFASGWCKQEVFDGMTRQLSNGSAAILPILVEQCEIPGFIAPYKWIDLGRFSLDDCCSQLLRRVRTDLSSSAAFKPSKFPQWLDDACEIGSLARRSATHILRGDQPNWHRDQLMDLYYRVCKIRTDGSSRLGWEWDDLLEELQNSIHAFHGTERDRERIEKARTAIRDKGQETFG